MEPALTPTSELEHLNQTFEAQRAAYRAQPVATYGQRKERLTALHRELLERKDQLAEAVDADFGGRSRHETLLAEVFIASQSLKQLRSHLREWMQPRQRPVSLVFQPATAQVVPQPLGLVGIISPWNYPVQLALVPIATALAAGNRVLLKPSEFTPNTAQALSELLGACLPSDVAAVTPGEVEVAVAFSQLPFDHLFFTGSTSVGRHIMRAAADNLTPVTLELGGKSPAIVHPRYPIATAAERIAAGKLFNAGQTCIAPDYALVPRGRLDEFVQAFGAAAKRMYPSFVDNPDYTAIINDRHRDRLQALLTDAEAKGAQVRPLDSSSEAAPNGKLPPSIVLGATEDMGILQDEIFGPLLPVMPYDALDDAIRYVNDHPRPLALYYFDHDQGRVDRVLAETTSGGVCVNDTLLHCAEENLPFGGVGPSGMGAYHGPEGFENLSHRKAVFQQSRINGAGLFAPPFGRLVDGALKFLLR